MTNSYDLPALRKELILILVGSLKKGSKFYAEDYNTICEAVNQKTRKELLESIERQNAINCTSKKEIRTNCQF